MSGGGERVPVTGVPAPDADWRGWRVIWEIDIEAGSARAAATGALAIMRNDDPANMAVVFQCVPPSGEAVTVDLLEELD